MRGVQSQVLPVVSIFVRQPHWAKGCQTAGKILFLSASLEEIRVGIGRLSKGDGPHQYGGVLPDLLRAE